LHSHYIYLFSYEMHRLFLLFYLFVSNLVVCIPMKYNSIFLSLAGGLLAVFAHLPAHADTPIAATTIAITAPSSPKPTLVVNTNITEAEVLAAQQAWGDALVAISTTYEQNGQAAAKALAEKVIDQAYGYQMGTVLFKPTLTTAPQTFRTTRAGALAYFVGGDPAFPKRVFEKPKGVSMIYASLRSILRIMAR
jgi:hypothetical protein